MTAAVLRERLKPDPSLVIKDSELSYNEIVEQALLWALVAGRGLNCTGTGRIDELTVL
jgi:hypothetical protein